MRDLFSRFRRRQPNGLSCRELVELVTDYLEGALSPTDRARFETHIDLCDDCRTYLRQMHESLAVLGTLPADALSPQAEADLRVAFREWRTAHS